MTSAHTLIDQLLQRVRDPQGAIVTRAFALTLLSKAQQFLNAKLGVVLDTTTLVAEPQRCFYPIREVLPQSQRVLFVQDGPRDLLYVPWRTFWYMKRGWPREIAERMQLWSTVGRDVLVLWPAGRVSTNVSVLSIKLTDPLTAENSAVEMGDEKARMIVDLAEVLALLKLRKPGLVTDAMQALTARITELAA